jgi:L-threonylcarbamoyladenylate synthase
MAEPRPPERVFWPTTEVERDRLLDRAAALLRRGDLVVFPTDTVYGVAADAAQPEAVARLFALKERPPSKQIALLVTGLDQLGGRVPELPAIARPLAERYWPGPLTLVLRDHEGGTVGVRVPNHPIPLALLARFGAPLATTSANKSAAGSPRTADEVLAQLPSGYPLLIDGGPCPGGIDSTVLDVTGPVPRLLRPGAIPRAELEALVGPISAAG